ncbi:leukotriene B4 receptor 1-like [Astyanax mexicanus]|uniref:leukotriene B4 receptor 1-like n=1 Tax=Astyanax mexicanus TaxID=7994 RepID=UPI000BBD5CAC|nr:leukotriene B4 receptor 1-like [Astyanax mexicanus]
MASYSQESLQSNFSWALRNGSSLASVIAECNKNGTPPARIPIQITVLVIALPANALLVWLLLRNKKPLSPSEVLGLNLAVLSIIYCLSLPLDIYISTRLRSGLLLRICHTFSILSYFGCPLLLSSMCTERFVAASFPVLFMRLGKLEYRAAYSAFLWLLTITMAAATYIYSLPVVAVALSFIINILFFFMLIALLGIVWVLCKKGPGDATNGEQRDSSIKKRALKNILAVIVPSTIIYLPVVALGPYLLLLEAIGDDGMNAFLCNGLQLFSVLPNFGVCIGPSFYLTRARQVLCYKSNET